MCEKEKKDAKLILNDGTELIGKSVGKKGTAIVEIVFSTSMTWYTETLTDKSYFGQIVMQTFPLIGNYGVNKKDYEGEKPVLSGYIVKNCSNFSSTTEKKENLTDWLSKNNVVAIEGIDTRYLTKKIRENGVLNGAITTEKIENKKAFLEKINNFKIENAIEKTSTKEIKILKSNKESAKDYVICVLDFGFKNSIIENLKKYAKKIFIMPHSTTKKEIEKIKPNGIVLSNGPGDPKKNQEIIRNIKEIEKLKIPMFGICMGHQLLALSNGADTKKLKYGHRGSNQPVLDTKTKKIFITSQNHGYYVVEETINKKIATVSHMNVNDGTCEGLEYLKIPAFSVQFHPEGSCGPKDTIFLFNKFFKLVAKNKI